MSALQALMNKCMIETIQPSHQNLVLQTQMPDKVYALIDAHGTRHLHFESHTAVTTSISLNMKSRRCPARTDTVEWPQYCRQLLEVTAKYVTELAAFNNTALQNAIKERIELKITVTMKIDC